MTTYEIVRSNGQTTEDETGEAAGADDLYVVESRRLNRFGGWTDWCSDEIGENEPRSRAECEQDFRDLAMLGPDWAEAEYRVREVKL